MAGIFPDDGVPANTAAGSFDAATTNCTDELFHSTTRCDPKFNPTSANAVLSELLSAINAAGIVYDCSRIDNLARAIQLFTGIAPADDGVVVSQGSFVSCDGNILYWNNTGITITVESGATCSQLAALGLSPVSAPPQATTFNQGVVELATNAEVNAGTDTSRVPTVAQMTAAIASAVQAASSGGEVDSLQFDAATNILTLGQTVGPDQQASFAAIGGVGGGAVADGVIISGSYNGTTLTLNSSLGGVVNIAMDLAATAPDSGGTGSSGGGGSTTTGGTGSGTGTVGGGSGTSGDNFGVAGPMISATAGQTEFYVVPDTGVTHVWAQSSFGGTCVDGLFPTSPGDRWELRSGGTTNTATRIANLTNIPQGLLSAGANSFQVISGNDTSQAYTAPSSNAPCGVSNAYLVPMG